MTNECGEEILSSTEAEDGALAQAIEEGLSTGRVRKQDVLEVLQEEPQASMVEGQERIDPSERRGG